MPAAAPPPDVFNIDAADPDRAATVEKMRAYPMTAGQGQELLAKLDEIAELLRNLIRGLGFSGNRR